MDAVQEAPKAATEAKENEKIKVTVCLSLSGLAEGGMEVYNEFEKQLSELKENVELGDKKHCLQYPK